MADDCVHLYQPITRHFFVPSVEAVLRGHTKGWRMALPKILYGVPLLALGALAPSALAAPAPAPSGAIGMQHEKFDQQTVRIHRGDTLRFVNNSGWLHVIGPGDEGRFATEAGTPALGTRGAFLSETGNQFVSGPWNTPGTYHITCSLHPEMNITVIVSD
jgi:plastocyanin